MKSILLLSLFLIEVANDRNTIKNREKEENYLNPIEFENVVKSCDIKEASIIVKFNYNSISEKEDETLLINSNNNENMEYFDSKVMQDEMYIIKYTQKSERQNPVDL